MAEKNGRNRYSSEAQQNLVRLVIDSGRKCAEVAAEHQVPAACVYAWVRRARLKVAEHSLGAKPTMASLQADVARLRRELKDTRDQALFLRKIAAFFASQKKWSLPR